MDSDSVLHLPQVELMKEYRYLDDHTHRPDVTSLTKDPVEYASKVLDKIGEMISIGVRTGPNTIFAPAKVTITSHIDMKDLFVNRGYSVLVVNGGRKGFYSGTEFVSIDDFNKKYSVNGELRDTLAKWRSLNPDENIAITGNLSIQRGITFNTIGFKFTDMIISYCHMTNINALIQLFGRANGGKKFVDVMNIWCPQTVIDEAKKQISINNALLNTNPEEFNEADFRNKTKREQLEPAMTVPIVIQLTKEEYESFDCKVTKTGQRC